MKGLMFQVQQQQQQLQQQVVEENMSNLTSASGEASVSSGNRTEIGTNYSQQYFAPPPTQTQPVVKKKRNLPGNPGLVQIHTCYFDHCSLVNFHFLLSGVWFFLVWN